ncbi:5360_t:CDS:1, partial [Ambispora gerdemannii]
KEANGDITSNIDHIGKNGLDGDVTSNTMFISILKVDVQNSNYTWVPVPDHNQSNPTSEKGKNIGGIVGGVIGGILVVALLAGLVFFFYRKMNKSKHGNSESLRGLTASTRQNSTQKSSFPPVSDSRSLPSIPWVSPLNSNTSTQSLQSAPVMLTPPLTNLNMSELSSVESRQPLDSNNSGPSLLSIPLVSTNPLSPFYRYDE